MMNEDKLSVEIQDKGDYELTIVVSCKDAIKLFTFASGTLSAVIRLMINNGASKEEATGWVSEAFYQALKNNDCLEAFGNRFASCVEEYER